MGANIEKIKELIRDKFHDNISYFAKEIGMGREYVSAIINERKPEESPKFCNAIITYCEKNNLNYKEFIIIN